MSDDWKIAIWQQLGATIDMFGNALNACPDELWRERLWDDPSELPEYAEFWFIAYHTLYWLDMFLNGTREGFAPPDYLQQYERGSDGILPKTPFTKANLQRYLAECRQKCQTTVAAMTDETAQRRCHFPWMELSFQELLLYTMRHVMEHAAQLNLVLGRKAGLASDWIPQVVN